MCMQTCLDSVLCNISFTIQTKSTEIYRAASLIQCRYYHSNLRVLSPLGEAASYVALRKGGTNITNDTVTGGLM